MESSQASNSSRLKEETHFVTTRWTAVRQAGQEDSTRGFAALSELCRAYWHPLYFFARRKGLAPADAEDITQAFFARLLEKKYLAAADQAKGKFRSFLLLLFTRFMANEWDRARAVKRGGQTQTLSFEQLSAEARYLEAPSHTPPEGLYDRQWAVTLLDNVMAALEKEYTATGRKDLFAALKQTLSQPRAAVGYRAIAERLNSTEGAMKMAARRLRQRYRELLREEVGKTVADQGQIEEELRDLFATFN